MNLRRVAITGLGAVTPVGNSAAAMWASLTAGRGGVGPLTHFDAADLTSRVAAQVKDFAPQTVLDKKLVRRTDPFVHFALAAAAEAVADSGVTIDDGNADRVGVVFGSGIGGLLTWDTNYLVLQDKGARWVSPFLIPMLIGNMAAGMVSIAHGARGPSKSVQTACATSAHSAGDAMRLIQIGDADVVIAGGAEAPIIPLACAGFCSMKALTGRNDDPEHASRPFDRERDGFVIGEGAAALVLEEMEQAKRRGATIYAELCGYGQTGDAYHMVQPMPCGTGAAKAMRRALEDAELNPADVGYINAHATSTPLGDISEVAAIRSVFGEALPPISATKSMTGHMLGAVGAVELIACALAIRDGILPPTINYEVPDPECAIDCVPNTARETPLKVAMSNSFGFGGHNCTLIVRAV